MTSSADLVHLQSLNVLLALATGSDPELTREIRAAIDFGGGAADGGAGQLSFHPTRERLEEAARRLLALHAKRHEGYGFEHCELAAERYEPLFVRGRVLSALHKLAGCPDAFLLVTGLSTAIRGGGRWSARRRADYQEAMGYIEALAAEHSAPTTHLRLLFV